MKEAGDILKEDGRDQVRSLMRTKEDLKALASEASSHTDAPVPASVSEQRANLNRMKSRILTITNELEQMRSVMDRNDETHNRYLDRYNGLVDEYNNLQRRYNLLADELNANNLSSSYITEIGGGISLRPKEFSVLKLAGSPLVSEMKSRSIMTKLSKMAPEGSWLRTRISIYAQDIGKALPDTAELGFVELEISGVGIQEIEIVSTQGHFGGFLRWFVCPGCKRRMGKLYLPRRAHVFLCRQCHRLGYKQQLLRAFRKTQYDKKIESKRDKKQNEELNVLRKLIEMLKAEKRMKQDELE